ncbi:MAG: ATP-binding protein [Pseudohongiellaceae bacterium]
MTADSRPLLAPIPMMLAGGSAALLSILLVLVFVLSRPWIGFELGYDESRRAPVVTAIEKSELGASLSVGDIIVGLSDHQGGEIQSLVGFQPGVEPPSIATYAAHNAYLRAEDKIADAIHAPTLSLHFLDGRTATVSVSEARTVSSLPKEFWLFNAFGLLAFTIGLAVYAVRPKEVAAQWLLLSGTGFFVATLFNSAYLSRELAWPYDVFLTLSRMNNIGLSTMLVSLLALMTYFPRQLTRISPAKVIVPIAVLLQANEWFQWYEWPLHAHYMPIFLLYMAGVLVAVYQWRLSRQNPIDRAALKWMLLAIFVIMGLGLAIYFLPIAFMNQAIFPQWAMVGIASLLYIGFAFGIVRYRLFDVQRWWLRIWSWFLGGLSVVVLDVLFISFLNLQPMVALGVAVIIVGWVYFPLRQWAFRRLTYQGDTERNQLIDQVERMAQAIPTRGTNTQWQDILVEQFSPAGFEVAVADQAGVRMEDHGAVLSVPMLQGAGALRLTYPDSGRRLFSTSDAEYVQSLLQVSRRIVRVHEAEVQAVRQERKRIVRDLHDDVGGHLLTLLRQAPSEHYEQLVRTALNALREAMQAMEEESVRQLMDCLDDWRGELKRRTQLSGVSLHWQQTISDPKTVLSVRQAINISRILNESLTNALQHAQPEEVAVKVELTGAYIILTVKNDGITADHSRRDPKRGRGLNNMATRSRELGGDFTFSIFEQQAVVKAVLPAGRY